MRLKSTINESTLSTADAVPLPQWGRLRYEDTAFPILSFRAKARNLFRLRSGKGCEDSGEREAPCSQRIGRTVFHADCITKENGNGKRKRSLGCARDDETRERLFPFLFNLLRKPTPPRCARQPPSKGRGLAWILPPSYGRRCPEGAEVGWGKRDERSEGRSFQLRRLRQYPNTVQQLLSWYCPKRGKEESARRFARPLISPKILIKILAMDLLLCYNTESAGMARLF